MTTGPTTDPLATTARSTPKRRSERGTHDRTLVNTILDEALVCHVGFVADHAPVVLPMTYVRIDDNLYLHGAAGNDMLRHLDRDGDVCVTVTLLDGLVFARSAFHHSMNYRCVVLFGRTERVTATAELQRVAAGLLDHLAPGRSRDARPPTAAELRNTLMLRLAITEGSAKVRTGGPLDEPDDLELDVWAGEVPLHLVAQSPIPDASSTERPELPDYIIDRVAQRSRSSVAGA